MILKDKLYESTALRTTLSIPVNTAMTRDGSGSRIGRLIVGAQFGYQE
jgi:hypothetical protein